MASDFAVTENGRTTYYDANGNVTTPDQATSSVTQGAFAGMTPQQAVQTGYANNGQNSSGAPIGSTDAGITAQQKSARALLADTLGQYGLGSLADKAWNLYLAGEPIEQVMLELRNTPEYKTRFPAMDALSKAGHAISESDYIGLERDFKQRFRASGLPEGFYDTPSDFTSFIANEVSPAELQSRLDEYTNITYQLPPIVRDELGRQYGLTPGDITAYIIDPTRALPILHNQVLAAQAGAGARQSGYGNLLNSEAEQLAGFGVDFNAATKGFGELVSNQQLFNPLLGDQGETAITRDQQIGAEFGGNAAAQKRIADRARKRAAEFQGGGSYQGGGFGTARGV